MQKEGAFRVNGGLWGIKKAIRKGWLMGKRG